MILSVLSSPALVSGLMVVRAKNRTTKVKRQDVFRRNALDSRRTTIHIQNRRFFSHKGDDAPVPPADPESI